MTDRQFRTVTWQSTGEDEKRVSAPVVERERASALLFMRKFKLIGGNSTAKFASEDPEYDAPNNMLVFEMVEVGKFVDEVVGLLDAIFGKGVASIHFEAPFESNSNFSGLKKIRVPHWYLQVRLCGPRGEGGFSVGKALRSVHFLLFFVCIILAGASVSLRGLLSAANNEYVSI